MYYTVIYHSGDLRLLKKCRKQLPVARVFYIFLVLSKACHVLQQYNTQLRLLYLLSGRPLFIAELIRINIVHALVIPTV